MTVDEVRDLLYRRDVAVTLPPAAVARKLGVTDGEMAALVHLAARSQLPPSVIAALLRLSSGGATALVQRLERAGHVKRSSHPTDRRKVLIHLTKKTAGRLADAELQLYDGLESTLATLSAAERIGAETTLTAIASLSEELAASLHRDAEAAQDTLSRAVPSLWA
jgi:MarR family transcriptional regulator, organic hydroperoxide resistance regulator